MRKTGNIVTTTCNRTARAVMTMLCLILMGSCQWRELELPDNLANIRVRLVTSDIRNVSCKIYNPEIQARQELPEVCHVLFFERESEQFVTEAFLSHSRAHTDESLSIEGDLIIAPGNYKMLIYSWGSLTTRFRDLHDWKNASAYTDPIASYIAHNYRIGSKTPMAEPIVEQPDHLWVVHEENEVIPPHAGIHVIEQEAHSVVDTYYLQVKIDGIENVSEAQAYITGLASGNLLSSGMMIREPSNSVHFSLYGSDDKGIPVLCNVFNTFGHVEGNTNKLEIAFSIRTRNGNVLNKSIDITDLFHTEDAINNHWLLLDETIEVKPDSGKPGGGMQPEVSEWTDQNVNLII